MMVIFTAGNVNAGLCLKRKWQVGLLLQLFQKDTEHWLWLTLIQGGMAMIKKMQMPLKQLQEDIWETITR